MESEVSFSVIIDIQIWITSYWSKLALRGYAGSRWLWVRELLMTLQGKLKEVNPVCNADDTSLMAESKEELKSLLRVKNLA